jgi:hypothetical protein
MSNPSHSRRRVLGGMVGAAGALNWRRSSGDEKEVATTISQWKCEQVWSCYNYQNGYEISCPPPANGSCRTKIEGWGATEDAAVADLNRRVADYMGPKCSGLRAIPKAYSPRSCTAPELAGQPQSNSRMVCFNGYHAISSFKISLPNCKTIDMAFDGYGTRRVSALRDARNEAELFAASVCGRICRKLNSLVEPCCQRPAVPNCSSCG